MDQLDLDTLLYLLVISDEHFLHNLKQLCEISICNFISLKNACQLLNMSYAYNASKLKVYIMEFISWNLGAFLEMKYLDILNDDTLDQLSKFYIASNKIFEMRLITPYSTTVSNEEIQSIATAKIVNEALSGVILKKSSNSRKKGRTRQKNVYQNEIDINKLKHEETALQIKSNIPFDDKNLLVETSAAISFVCSVRLQQEDSFVNLNRFNENPELNLHDFPALQSSSNGLSQSPKYIKENAGFHKHKIPKMSQRQKKKSLLNKVDSLSNNGKYFDIFIFVYSPVFNNYYFRQ